MQMRRMRAAVWVVVAWVPGAVAPAQAQEPVDLLLHNGKVFTADPLLSTYSSVAVSDGRIVALGWDELADTYSATRTIDLAGRLVLPGFIDTHLHIRGNPARWVDLAGLENLAELKAWVTRRAEQLGAGEWITGYGWSEDELAEQRRPFRWDLDDAAPANPVVLTRAGGHSSVASSLALEAAGPLARALDYGLEDGRWGPDAPVHGAIRRAQGGTAVAWVSLPGQPPDPPDSVWENHLPLLPRPGRPARSLPLLDTQGPRENRRDEAHRRRTRPLPGVDREQPRIRAAREGNARPLFARACLHNRPGGPMNPRVSGSSSAVTATAILQTLRPAH